MKRILALALLMTLVACKGNPQKQTAQAFVADLNVVYGSVSPGVSASFVKLGEDSQIYAVVRITDGATTVYAAIDVSDYVAGMDYAALVTYLTTHDVYQNLTPNANGTFSCAAGCTNNNGDSVTLSMVFETTQASARDLETAAAFAEEYAVKQSAENLSAKFALSSERSFEVASMMNQWNKISKNRAMTEADADAFAVEVIGSTASDVQAAFKRSLEGDASDLNALIEQAAEVNGISSENMNKIVSELFL